MSKLPSDWKAKLNIYDSLWNLENKAAFASLCKGLAIELYALTQKPPKELSDAELEKVHIKIYGYGCDASGHKDYARAIIAAHIAKQSEPERVKFRAAVYMGNDVEMLTVLPNDDWEWLEPEQSFEVVLP